MNERPAQRRDWEELVLVGHDELGADGRGRRMSSREIVAFARPALDPVPAVGP